ncbi:MAG: glycosyltransferase family 4 protein, partial [Actinobacteria bacterium]|nr:glycosyltransferase family 4 protein [Actinomycetota bacterium]
MNILFLMITFPDMRKNSNLYTDLVEEFNNNGHNVFVTTLLERKNNKNTFTEKINGITILRVKCGDMFNVSLVRKGMTTISLPYKFKQAINKYFNHTKFDLVIYPTPPITFAPVVKYIKKRDECKSYLILRDIFPQNARDLGLMNNNLLFNYFRKKEQQLYDLSDYIGCMSQGNIKYVIEHNNIAEGKLEILYNWKKIGYDTKNDAVDYKKKYGLENKFVAIFGGNIGLPQELEFLLELAREYKNRDDIVFLIFGEGTEKGKMINIIKDEKLPHVVIKNNIRRDDYQNLIKQCDIGLINLSRKFTIPNIPSKTTDYFEAGIPILASTDRNTDYKDLLIKKAKAGLWSETGDLEGYKINFEKLFNDENLRKELGKNGRKFLEENLSAERTYQIISKHFE